jgi:myo-inositol-1(or 4)-monophosphatase
VPVGGGRIGAWEWDVAVVDLIVREAGGAVTDLRGAPLRYNRPTPLFDRGLLISRDPELHRGILAALATESGAARVGRGREPDIGMR